MYPDGDKPVTVSEGKCEEANYRCQAAIVCQEARSRSEGVANTRNGLQVNGH